MRATALLSVTVLFSAVAFADTAQERLQTAATVVHDILAAPDTGIPQDLVAKAACAVVIPGMKKAAFGVGGQYGRGFEICRESNGEWGAPAAVRLEGGSFGFQIGGSSTDIVMLVMNRSGVDKLLKDKFTIGADASAAAGPVGRTAAASTNARMDAEILTWSRSKGAFAGISLNGATLRNDLDENQELYGQKLTNQQIIEGNTKRPAAAEPLVTALNSASVNKQPGEARRDVDKK